MMLPDVRTHDGKSLRELARDRTVLLVFVRHLGCTFARQALADLGRARATIEAADVLPVLVHPGDERRIRMWATRYHLGDIPRIADREGELHRACSLLNGSLRSLVTPRVLGRWLTSAFRERHGFGWTTGDVRRLGGAVLVERGVITRAVRCRTSADRIDLAAAARGEAPDTILL